MLERLEQRLERLLCRRRMSREGLYRESGLGGRGEVRLMYGVDAKLFCVVPDGARWELKRGTDMVFRSRGEVYIDPRQAVLLEEGGVT